MSLTPETNPIHPCYGCQSCLAELIDDEDVEQEISSNEV